MISSFFSTDKDLCLDMVLYKRTLLAFSGQMPNRLGCKKLMEFIMHNDVSTFYNRHPQWQLHFVGDRVSGVSSVTSPTTLCRGDNVIIYV